MVYWYEERFLGPYWARSPVPTEHDLNGTVSLSISAEGHDLPISQWILPGEQCTVQVVWCRSMASPAPRSESNTFGMWYNGGFVAWVNSWQIGRNYVRQSSEHLPEMFLGESTSHGELRLVWEQSGVLQYRVVGDSFNKVAVGARILHLTVSYKWRDQLAFVERLCCIHTPEDVIPYS